MNYFVYGSPPRNNFVYFRFPDVLLMKAEAILRGGAPTNAGVYGNSPWSLVNTIGTHPSRGVSSLPFVNLDILLDERGRELWWENWRRQDLIRFQKFLEPFQEKITRMIQNIYCFLYHMNNWQLTQLFHKNRDTNKGYRGPIKDTGDQVEIINDSLTKDNGMKLVVPHGFSIQINHQNYNK